MIESSSHPYRVCTQDKNGFYEAIIPTANGWAYYLFDSPNRPWKQFATLEEAISTISTTLKQRIFTFSTPEELKSFYLKIELDQDNLWVNGHKTQNWTNQLTMEAVVIIDTGKDYIDLKQDPDESFFWRPQSDPSYRNLGEKLVTIQDAIRKIEEMPVYIFETKKLADAFFKDSYPGPLIQEIGKTHHTPS